MTRHAFFFLFLVVGLACGCSNGTGASDLSVAASDLSVADLSSGNPGSDAAVPADLGACTTKTGNVVITSNAEWATLVGGGCVIITGVLEISAPGVTSFTPAANQITSIGGLGILNNTTLTSLSLPALTTVTGEVNMGYDDALTSLSFPALTTVGSNFAASNMPALTTVSLPALKTLGGNLNFIMDPELTSVSVPVLTTTNEIDIDTAPKLPSFSLPALTTTAGVIAIKSNAIMTSVSAPLLTTSASIYITSNPALTTLTLSALTTVSGAMTVQLNAALRQCVVDAIKTKITTGPTTYTTFSNDGMPNTCP